MNPQYLFMGTADTLLGKFRFLADSNNKELERLITINKIDMSVDQVLEAAKTITTIRIRLPEHGSFFTKTLFLTDKHLAIRPLFEKTENNA